ncbi:DUF4446 family protein [Clostridium septicum]|uniref:DUF4446 domain-containing protein n=1 Tax=Clostridium septicum TaxID=1504 RepID=A0A9N7JKJ1_CLOSE|nr:DUF4446 family protein [Clostridium septicum]AYE34318.1 DUF4446 domain-containing protein [Clostridium septicum]MDU1314274.1 DUF4446 family protein [Clostridium septicum]QAS59712.1 DUF4446 family protein [Clostridium septicum]UEC21045.1 DUF4446 family protein [Clostridium septicum]USS00907.1 DUF4446 family protein [Clostridium septicum]
MQNIINMINDYSSFLIIGLAVIVILLFIVVLVLMRSINKVELKYRKMMRGVNNKNLEALINSKLDEIDKAVEKSEESIKQCEITREEMKDCVNKVAIMRYKAFEDVGSDLSFSVAILDSHNDGVMLTGIYSRQESITYAKPIDKGISRYELSEEELHVLNEAMNK